VKRYILITIFSFFLFKSCDLLSQKTVVKKDTYVADNYTKEEVNILMRDGTKLHTTIYTPKDNSKKHPILLQRTPYSSKPYGDRKSVV
jgi:hypothetical protein